jgi:hypothetical protein
MVTQSQKKKKKRCLESAALVEAVVYLVDDLEVARVQEPIRLFQSEQSTSQPYARAHTHTQRERQTSSRTKKRMLSRLSLPLSIRSVHWLRCAQ